MDTLEGSLSRESAHGDSLGHFLKGNGQGIEYWNFIHFTQGGWGLQDKAAGVRICTRRQGSNVSRVTKQGIRARFLRVIELFLVLIMVVAT